MHRHAAVVAALVASLFLTGLPAAADNQLGHSDDASCSRTQTVKLVKRFVRAFNRGDVDRLDRLWAHEPDFQWYFVDDEREQSDAEDRLTLRLYFQERVLLNDHLRLQRLRINPNGTDFAFKLLRTTDDERDRAAGLFHGKGAARDSVPLPSLSQPIPTSTCLLIVWAMDNHTE